MATQENKDKAKETIEGAFNTLAGNIEHCREWFSAGADGDTEAAAKLLIRLPELTKQVAVLQDICRQFLALDYIYQQTKKDK